MTSSWDDHGVASLVQYRTVTATLPLVLCAPHGGNAVDGDQAETLLERPDGTSTTNSIMGSTTSGGSVNLIADVGTSQLVEEIDRRVAQKFGEGRGDALSSVVIAKFHRKYIDANRSLGDEGAVAVHPACTRAREVHEYYHHAIESAVNGVLARSRGDGSSSSGVHLADGRGLLLDVHGQSAFDDKVLVGTCNGKTADLEALNAPGDGFLWHLRRILDNNNNTNGHCSIAFDDGGERHGDATEEGRSGERTTVVVRAGEGQATPQRGGGGGGGGGGEHNAAIPAVVVLPLLGQEEVRPYTGGYTVQRHGLSQVEYGGLPMGAVQLEFGKKFRRTPEAREAAAEAVALAAFYHSHPLDWLLEEVASKQEKQQQQQQQRNCVDSSVIMASSSVEPCTETIAFVVNGTRPSSAEEVAPEISAGPRLRGAGSGFCIRGGSMGLQKEMLRKLRLLGIGTGQQMVAALSSPREREKVNGHLAAKQEKALSAEEAAALVRVYDELATSGARR